MSQNKLITGKCLCGSVSLSFHTDKDFLDACHCGMCRKWGGGPALTVDAGKDLEFAGKEFISTYSSSDWAERGFCKQCGTHLFYRLKETGFMNVPLGLLDKSEQFKFHLQIYIDRKPAHYDFSNKTEFMTEADVVAKYLNP